MRPGSHLLADLYGVPESVFRSPQVLERALSSACAECGLHALAPPRVFSFEGGGLTGFVCLAESHIALHTYPEHDFIALDVFTCGDAEPTEVLEHLRRVIRPSRVDHRVIERGSDVSVGSAAAPGGRAAEDGRSSCRGGACGPSERSS